MAFGLPKMNEITNQLNGKFDEMMKELRSMKAVLDAILTELRTQRGGSR